MKMTAMLVAVICFSVCGFAGDGKSIKQRVRDPYGRLLYTTTTRGNQTEVRGPSGKLLIKSKTLSNGRTESRSPSGKLLFKSK
jgi:hypothetical protein